MDWLIDQLLKEEKMIREAPISFSIVCVLAFLFAGMFWYKKFKIQLALKTDDIQAYRDRLNLEGVTNAKYSGKSNKKLATLALEIASGLRALWKDYQRESRAMSEEQWITQSNVFSGSNSSPQDSPKLREQIKAIMAEHARRYSQLSDAYMERYRREFKNDVALLFGEMNSRLPAETQKSFKNDVFRFEFPANPDVLERVADALERTAKMLP